MFTAIFGTAVTLFMISNPIGNSPAIMALVKSYPFERQRWILFREGVFSLLVALFFQYFGNLFLTLLHAKDYAVALCGGVVLLLLALHMIFPKPEKEDAAKYKQEPFLVPIAIPLISGPGLMTMIMVYSKDLSNHIYMTAAILVAFSGVILILSLAPYLQRAIGEKGMLALEQVMGMILALIAMQMIVTGTNLFVENL
jgi:multiple antibiotic resistance protein